MIGSVASTSTSTQWPTQAEVWQSWGNPSLASWQTENLVHIQPPFRMKMGLLEIHQIAFHKKAAPSLLAVLEDYWQMMGREQEACDKDGGSVFSGSFAIRPIRGKSVPSMHSLGLAIDFNAPKNPLGRKPGATSGSFTVNSPLVKCFDRVGALWGGRWQSRPDGMHFQFARV